MTASAQGEGKIIQKAVQPFEIMKRRKYRWMIGWPKTGTNIHRKKENLDG
jgi:hypothetical protein